MTAYAFYRVELDRADGTTAVEFRKRRKATTAKGMSRQHDNVVNSVIEEITTATGWCIKSIDYRHILN